MKMRCNLCGNPEAAPVDLFYLGVHIDTYHLCLGCLADRLSEIAEKEREFRELLAAGLTHEQADQIMVERMNLGKAH